MLKNLAINMKNPTQAKWGNKLGFWLFPLPMVHYEDPLDYCRTTRSTARIKKSSFESSLTFALATSLATKLVEYIANKINTSTTLGFSNLIGPADEIEFCDNHVTHIIPTAYVNHTSIVMHFISYSGKGKLVALVSDHVVPDPQQLCSDCTDALHRMKEAAHK
uniref:O-acyltransferase WSD1 C-terminal domain-containing protein n=1 Tax=Picea sitchensis TaxID=3332 RepID=D5AC33_PICSI|nr:unknown [Picea sitchensis]